jgi:hypothetical protein
MTCDDTRRRLTAYLDGDLDADGGTLVRVHLRGCAPCRQVATDEAALRDGLRALPSLDPPPSLWAGVQARLAEAEADAARRPRWRRALARWAPAMPRFALGGALAAAAVTALWWKTQRVEEPAPIAGLRALPEVIAQPPTEIKASGQGPGTAPAPVMAQVSPMAAAPPCHAPEAPDATADLALDTARRSGCYAAEVESLLVRAGEVRAQWTDEQRASFDGGIASLRQAVAAAAEGRPRQRAWRSMVRYLQTALARDEVVALASGGIR